MQDQAVEVRMRLRGKQAALSMTSKVVENTGADRECLATVDPAYCRKLLRAVRECEAIGIMSWLNKAGGLPDAAGSARKRCREGEKDVEEEKKAKKEAVQRGEEDGVEEEEEKVEAEEPEKEKKPEKEEGVEDDRVAVLTVQEAIAVLNQVEAFVEVFLDICP